MLTLVAVLHILIALMLITLVLLQDSKGGGAGGVLGGSGSNSLLGATGATTLLEKLTRWFAVAFATTCILLTVLTAQNNGSVVDTYVPPPKATVPVAIPGVPGAATGAATESAAAPAGATPAAPTTPPAGGVPAQPQAPAEHK